jgi:hypothetical protein
VLALSRLADCPFSALIPAYRERITRVVRPPFPAGRFILNGALAATVHAQLASDGSVQWTSQEILVPPDGYLRAVAAGSSAAWSSGTTMWIRGAGGQEATSMPVPELAEPGTCVALLSAGALLATASRTAIRMYDVESARLAAVADMPNAYTGYGLDRMWGTRDGRLVTSKYASQLVWDQDLHVLTSLDRFRLTGHYICHANAVDRDGVYFAACAMGSNIAVVDTRHNALHANLPIPEGDGGRHIASDIDFHPDHSNILVAVQPDGAIVGCDVSAGAAEVLATDRRHWVHGFFAAPDVFVAVDTALDCAIWRVNLVKIDE